MQSQATCAKMVEVKPAILSYEKIHVSPADQEVEKYNTTKLERHIL